MAMNNIKFTESQLKQMGLLIPELYDPTYQAPLECVEWFEQLERERLLKLAQPKFTIEAITLVLLKVCAILSWVLSFVLWIYILQS